MVRNNFRTHIYDSEQIEFNLLHRSHGLKIAERFFPQSYSKWAKENPSPALLYDKKPTLECKICGTEIFENVNKNNQGHIIMFLRTVSNEMEAYNFTEKVEWVCGNDCDTKLCDRIRATQPDLIDGWYSVKQHISPIGYIQFILSILDELKIGDKYSDEAFNNIKHYILTLYPYISREQTSIETDFASSLIMMSQL